MARKLDLEIGGNSAGADKALAATEAALGRATRQVKQAEAATDSLAVKARKLAEAEERAADKARDLAAKAAAMRKQIEESGDATGDLGRQLDKLTRDTRNAALATDDYRRSADRAARDAREQARAYDQVADNARQAARAVALLRLASAGRGRGGSAVEGGGNLLSEISSGFLKGGLGGASSALEGTLGTPILGPALLALAAAAAVPAASFIGGAAGGGVGLGLGAGGAALGLAGAWQKDPEKFQAKWSASIGDVKKRWLDSSAAFGNELDGALKIADRTLRNLPVEKVLALSQSFVLPLAEGGGRGLNNFANGLADALERVQPIIDEVGPDLANLGTDLGDTLRAISLGSEGGAEALGDLINVIGYGAKATGVLILGFENTYKSIRDFVTGAHDATRAVPILGNVLAGAEHSLFGLGTTATTTGRRLKDAGDAGRNSADGWLDAVKAGAELTVQAQAANDALTKLRDTQLGMANANIAVAQGWLDLKEELKDGAKTLDLNTQEGIDNTKSILEQADALERQREQTIKLGNDTPEAQAKASAAYDAGIQKLRETAIAAGFTEAQVNDLLRAYGYLPPVVTTQIQTPGLEQALGQGISLGNALNRIDGETYTARVNVTYNNPGISIGNLLHHARGGEFTSTGPKMVGEHGAEIVWGSRNEYVSTAEQTRQLASMMGSSGSSGSNGPMRVVVAHGGDTAVGALVQTLVDRGVIQIFAGGNQVSTRR